MVNQISFDAEVQPYSTCSITGRVLSFTSLAHSTVKTEGLL